MIIGNLWGLLGLLSIPAIIILHVYRQRFQPRQTSALFLFGPEQLNQASGRTRERLRRTGSLIAELLCALALTWFLCDPHVDDHQEARHLICVLDGHLRLQARDETGRSAQDRARQTLLNQFDQMQSHDRITLIQSGQQPSLLTASAVSLPQAKLALDAWTCQAGWHPLRDSFAMASDLQAASEHAQVIILSDQQRSDIPDDWQCLSFGLAQRNSGLIDVRWFNDQDGQRLNLRLYRHDDRTQRSIDIHDKNGKHILSHTLDQRDGVQRHLIRLPEQTPPELQLQLSGQDHLSFDDSCTLIKPPRQMIRVTVSEGCLRRTAIIRALEATRQVRMVDRAAHVQITDTVAPNKLPDPGTWRIHLQARQGDAVIGPFLARSGHPLLQDVDFTGCLWSGTSPTLPVHQQSLLQASSNCLISEQRQQGTILQHWYLDLEKSTLHRHPAWPSLFANLVQWRLAYIPGLQYYQLSSAMTNRLVLPPGNDSVWLHYPNDERQQISADLRGIIELPRMRDAGIYRLSLNSDPEQIWQEFIVHRLHQRSSDLSLCSTETPPLEDATAGKVQRIRTRIEHMTPLALALLAALTAWFCYRNEQGILR